MKKIKEIKVPYYYRKENQTEKVPDGWAQIGGLMEDIIQEKAAPLKKQGRPLVFVQRGENGLSGIVPFDLDKKDAKDPIKLPELENIENAFFTYHSSGGIGVHVWTYWEDLIEKPLNLYSQVYEDLAEMCGIVEFAEEFGLDYLDLKTPNRGSFLSADRYANWLVL